MIKRKTILHDVKKLFPILKNKLLAERDIVFVYIFGSYGINKIGPLSDVDIALYLDENEPLNNSEGYFDRKIELNLLITEILKTDEVDIVILNEASPELIFNVLKTGYLLFSKDENKRFEFEARAMKNYQDFKYHREKMIKAYFDKIKSEIRNE